MSSSPPILSHFKSRVTPGLAALSQSRRFNRRFMSADFPTFGNPITHARTGRGLRPRTFRLLLISVLMAVAALVTWEFPPPLTQLLTAQMTPEQF